MEAISKDRETQLITSKELESLTDRLGRHGLVLFNLSRNILLHNSYWRYSKRVKLMSDMSFLYANTNLFPVPTKTKTTIILALTKWKTFYKPVILL